MSAGRAGFIMLRRKRGWTLLEMTVAIVVFTILGLTLTGIYAAGATLMQVSENKLALQQQARLGLDRMLKELRLARPGSVTIDVNQNAIIFQIPQTIDPNSGAITWSAQITYSVGGLNNTQLLRTEGANTTVICNDVNNTAGDPNRLIITGDQNPNPNLVTIALGVRRTTLRGHVAQATLTGEARVRNP